MTEKTMQHHEEEISLLDILVTLAESWKLLVFGPLLVGVLAGGLSFLWPKTFESVAIVRLTEEEVALLHAAPVLDPLIEKFGYLQAADGIKEDARAALKKDLSFSTDKRTKFATVVAKGRTPESSQALGQAVMDALLGELQPKGKEKEAILQELAVNNQLIEDGVYFVERHGSKQNINKDQIANLKLNNLELEFKLIAKGKEIYAQEPSLPQRNTSPSSRTVVTLSLLFTLLILIMMVFLRKIWNFSYQDEKSKARILEIKKILKSN